MTSRTRPNVLAGVLVAVAIGMTGMAFAAVPLYRMFCAATGYGGTPNTDRSAAPGATSRTITVRFDAEIQPGMPWTFAPEQTQITLPLGAEQIAFYSARNRSASPVTGVAVYNVTPDKVGHYFHKTACFCFNQQVLPGGQEMQLPVSFWVDPAIATDPNTADVRVITLSYTFFRSLMDAAADGALARAGPHVGPLKQPVAASSALRSSGT
jgi:cytochrome c oxidase assembly protein subunit 11